MKTMFHFASLLALLAFVSAGDAASTGSVVRVDVKLDVIASSTAGVKFVAPESGTYTLTIVSGAFCYLPQQAGQSSPYDGWLTQIQFYKNKPVKWGAPDEWGKHPIGADGSVGNGDHQANKAQAAAAGKGASTTVELQKGQSITFLVSDGSDWYSDNEGSVKIGISAEIPQIADIPSELPEDS